MPYREKDIKRLWGLAGGRCSFPDCRRELFAARTRDVLGQIAHIIARNEEGPRGDATYPVERLNDYENLILLCADHHAIVDKDVEAYTVGWLRRAKTDHETWVKSRLSIGKGWEANLSDLLYVNVPRLSIYAGLQGVDIEPFPIERVTSLNDLGFGLTRMLMGLEGVVSNLQARALAAEEMRSISEDLVGATLSFASSFRTKNVPAPQDFAAGSGSPTGDARNDPHVYRKFSLFTLVLPIDPRWITTTTAWTTFRGGHQMFAGLAMVKSVLVAEKVVVGTPIILGLPKSPLAAVWD